MRPQYIPIIVFLLLLTVLQAYATTYYVDEGLATGDFRMVYENATYVMLSCSYSIVDKEANWSQTQTIQDIVIHRRNLTRLVAVSPIAFLSTGEVYKMLIYHNGKLVENTTFYYDGTYIHIYVRVYNTTGALIDSWLYEYTRNESARITITVDYSVSPAKLTVKTYFGFSGDTFISGPYNCDWSGYDTEYVIRYTGSASQLSPMGWVYHEWKGLDVAQLLGKITMGDYVIEVNETYTIVNGTVYSYPPANITIENGTLYLTLWNMTWDWFTTVTLSAPQYGKLTIDLMIPSGTVAYKIRYLGYSYTLALEDVIARSPREAQTIALLLIPFALIVGLALRGDPRLAGVAIIASGFILPTAYSILFTELTLEQAALATITSAIIGVALILSAKQEQS